LVSQDTCFAEVSRAFILVHFKLFDVKLENRNQCEIPAEIPLNQPHTELVRLGLFDLLSEFVVGLI
jgi:hypothetical protein